MNKYKVCVYAICKNEEKFVKRWVKSMSEADQIFVLDTGSTDNTVKLLKSLGVKVKIKKITPWRFDIARNESIKMIPKNYDICVCTDLDEIFNEGWRNELEKTWKNNTNKLKYIYNWSLDENNNPIISFFYEKIHDRKNYSWKNPVHEILKFNSNNMENIVINDKIILNHYPDSKKSRSSYLPLLELSVKEDPTNDRNMHYLGREYMFYGMWNEAIDTLIKHLNMPNSTWNYERSASMRFIARSYINLKRYDEAKMWLDKAISESKDLRDPLVERAILEYQLSNWDNVEKYCNMALKITNHEKLYMNEVFSWDYTIYDLLSLSSYNKLDFTNALKWINKALEMEPTNERLIKNKEIIENKIN